MLNDGPALQRNAVPKPLIPVDPNHESGSVGLLDELGQRRRRNRSQGASTQNEEDRKGQGPELHDPERH